MTTPNCPRNLDDLLERVLPERIRAGVGDVVAPPSERLVWALRRYRASGRITLLLDSIDQASARGLRLVRGLLEDKAWENCPIVISSRPDAIFQKRNWQRLIRDEKSWRFVRIEPLAKAQRKLLLNQGGVNRYRLLPASGA